MRDERSIHLIFVWIPDEEVHGVVTQENPHWCRVQFTKNGILHNEIFPQEDIVYLKEITIEEEGAVE
jgi:hypothetical protein